MFRVLLASSSSPSSSRRLSFLLAVPGGGSGCCYSSSSSSMRHGVVSTTNFLRQSFHCRQYKYYGSMSDPTYGRTSSKDTATATASKDSKEKHMESFKVAHISYATGKLRQIYLPPTEILKRMSILPRDLVSLHLKTRQERKNTTDNNSTNKKFNNNNNRQFFLRPPTAILPRTDCILLSFGNIRAVACRNEVYILDAHSQIAKSFAKEVSKSFQQQQKQQQQLSSSSNSIDKNNNTNETIHHQIIDPPELIFVEVVLRDAVETYMRRIRVFEPIVNNFLDRVVGEVFSFDRGVHQLAPLKDALQSFELQVKQSVDCLTMLLNDDDEMLKLLLTEQELARTTGVPVEFERHQHVELFLGVYARQLNNILQEINYLLGRLQSKQEFVALALAGYRNRLVRMNVNIGIIGMSTGITTAVTGLFGMNLISGLEETVGTFYIVTALSTSTAILIGTSYFRFMSETVLQKRAAERLDEIETITNALSDMSALDYTVKKMNEGGDIRMDKEEFRKRLKHARMSQYVSNEEVDLLFNALDCHKDNYLTKEDFEMNNNNQPYNAS